MVILHLWDSGSFAPQKEGTGSLTGLQKTYEQEELLVFVDYTKGDEERLELSFKYVDSDIEGVKFDFAGLMDFEVSPVVLKVVETGTVVIPVPLSACFEGVEIKAELVGAGAGEGTAEIWLKPGYAKF